jgi:hypothetical protein
LAAVDRRAAATPRTLARHDRDRFPLCFSAPAAVGRSPEPGRFSLPRWLLRPKMTVGRSFLWAGPLVKKKNEFRFFYYYLERKML